MMNSVIDWWVSLFGNIIKWIFSINVFDGISLGEFFLYCGSLGLVLWFIFDIVIGGDE